MELWFSEGLQNWYQKNKRDLPWRKEKDPYKIWISEIILQQTQVAQGLAYYLRFIKKYPRVQNLAKAEEDEVMKMWQGLGYYSRARNLHASAKIISNEYNGQFPTDYAKIKQLKGVGDYTAAAIASFAYNTPKAVVDGNVYRLLSRLFGIKTPIDSGAAKKEFAELAELLLDKKRAAIYNQAIMEFGSQYCKPVQPNCEACIFNDKCVAFKENLVEQLPIKEKKTKVKERYFNFMVLLDKRKNVSIEKRKAKDIWHGLYQFPLLESKKLLSQKQVLASLVSNDLLHSGDALISVSKTYKHLLTHQTIYAQFFIFKLKGQHPKNTETIKLEKLTTVAFPRLIEIFLNEHSLEEIN